MCSNTILLPSVALPGTDDYRVRCSVTAGEHRWTLADVSTHESTEHSADPGADHSNWGNDSDPTAAGETRSAISTHIDLFAIHEPIANAVLQVEVVSQQPLPALSGEPNYLLVVSRRAQQLPATPPGEARPVYQVPTLSQLQQPQAQRHRTCSPTALSMVMSHYNAPFYPAFVDQCRDPTTGLYGVWPRNIVQAARRGFVAAAELVADWEAVADHSGPFVASLQFQQGELAGSPLPETPGHLVVVCGTRGDRVVCNDPAAPSAAEVTRDYDQQQFSTAWLGQRGACYIAVPIRS